MEENKVTLKLDDYLELYNENNELKSKLNEILSLLINNTELTSNKKQLQMDGYNCKYGRIIDLVKELKPEEYKKRYEYLMQDEEEELMAKTYITPTLLNSWSYCIKNGTLEDFIKVLNQEPFEDTESIIKGKQFEAYMQENYPETLNGAYQVKVRKEYGDYLLYGIVDCLKGGIIYDYKYTKSYDVGKFFNNHQTLMYLEMIPEASKMVYLITNKFEEIEYADNNFQDIKNIECTVGDIFREEYTKDMFPETIDSILHKFENWLKQYNLFDLYTEKWKCKY